MITISDIGHIIFDECRFLDMPTYVMTNLPDEYVSSADKVDGRGRIVVIPKFATADKTYFNDCTVEVNILLPDVGGEANNQLDVLLRKAYTQLDDGRCGDKDGDFWRISVQRYSIEDEPNLNCHYVNLTILFEILNIRR